MYTILPIKMWLGKLAALDMTPMGWLGRKTSTQTKDVKDNINNKTKYLDINV